jgi:mono/diheme cytochrome c family protein
MEKTMNRRIFVTLAALAIGTVIIGGCKKETPQKAEVPQAVPASQSASMAKTGEELFKQQCAACHLDGGNTVNPKKTLHRQTLMANNITKPEDIVKIMRNPGTGMNKFDEATLPEKDAMAIAEYVLNTFK